MNVICLALVVALCLHGYIHLAAWFPGRIRDDADTAMFLVGVGVAFLLARCFRSIQHYSVIEIMAAAFLGEVFVALRTFLVVITDLCKVNVLTKNQRRSR